MSGNYFKATVKEVLSGDSLTLVGAARPGTVPSEKRLTLSSLIAPKLGKRDGTTKDEPFAWESREYLRKKLIGQGVTFRIDYVVEAIGNKEFGSVFLQTSAGQQENVALSIVQNGWAKVRESGSQQSPIIEDLRKAQDAAQQAGAGLWTKDPQAMSKSVRPVGGEAFNAMEFLQKVGKSKPVAGIVEAVLNGSTLRVTLLPDLTSVTVHVSGVQCPSMSKRPPGASTAVAAADSGTPAVTAAANGEEVALAAPTVPVSAPPAGQPEPFAREAKWFSEQRALNREVRIVLDGVDKYQNLFGSVMYPDGDKPASLAETLVQAGLAKCVEWSLQMMTVGAMRLREMERAAKAAKRGVWHSYVPVATGQTKLSDSFVGRVNEVASGDTLIVKDVNAGVERRVQLSSIRAPRVGIRDRPPEPHGNEAREFLRKRFIGKEVNVKMEYTRKVQPMPGAEGAAPAGEERVLSFGNVELLSAKEGEDKNAAEMAVARGYASVIRHRTDEERSSVYERLVELEEAAKAAKRGIHSNKDVAPPRLNDVSLPGNAARAKQYLPFFQRSGRVAATVEYVLSGHRLKIHVPKEGVSVAFAPSGIKTPARAQGASHGRPAVAGEPHADEAFAFTRDNFMQRDVEIEVESVDKGGTFLGTVVLQGPKPINLGTALLRQGLAKLQPFFSSDRVKGGAELEAAQTAAKQARLKIWENWSPEDDKVEGDDEHDAGEGAPAAGAGEVLNVTVTEVASGNEFFVQVADEPRVRWVEEQLKGMSLGDSAPAAVSAGGLALAQFTLDNNWYRAYVEKVHPSEPRYEVFFVDYGNRERLPSDRIRPCDAAVAAVPPQAKAAQLAYLRIPGLDEEFGQDAASTLAQLVGGGKQLRASVISRERGTKERHPAKAGGKLVVVLKEEGAARSINAEMLAAGMARLPSMRKLRDALAREAVTKLGEYQEDARRAHRGMFEYGDPGDSDDEAEAPRKPAARGGRR